MQRISGPTAPNRRFVAEDPLASQPGTIITAEWLNSVQEELANLLEKAGVPLDASNTSQLHELLNGRQAALTAPADLRPATGDTIEGDILAACDTPAGVAIATSKNHLYLCAGGRVQGVRMQPDETATWATLYCNGAKLIRCALVSGFIRTESWDLIPGSTQVAQFTLQGSSSGSGASGTSVIIATASAPLSNYRRNAIAFSDGEDSDMRVAFRLIDGWIVSPNLLVFVRRRLNTESGTDRLQVVVRWIWADVNVDAIVCDTTISTEGELAFPTDTWLAHWTVGARIPLSDDSLLRCAVVFPAPSTAETACQVVAFTVDDGNLTTTDVSDETYTLASSALSGAAPDSWTPGLQLTPFNGGAILHQRLSSDAVRLSVGASSLSMTAGALPDSARLLGCVVRSETPVLFAELDGALTAYTWATSAPQKILSLAANQLAARVDLSELERSRLSYRPSADLADLDDLDEFGSDSGASANVSGTASGGLALHLWGLCLASRTPLWGPWTARTATPAIPIGTDSGRLVALCPHKTFAISETSASSAQTLTLCVSPPA